MANPMLIQKQIKDNTEDLHNFVRDLKHWEEDMKRKDRQLSNDKNEEIIPPVRRAKVSKKSKPNNDNSTKKKIPSYDYKRWDNFDVEKACEEIDNEDNKNESEEENEEEKAKQEEKYMKEKALYEKEIGNKYVKASKWDEAIESYTRAIAAYSQDPVFYANRALCYFKKKKYEAAEADCQTSLKLDSTYVKAYLRCAAAQEALERYEDARHSLRCALQLEPHNQQAQKDLTRLTNHNTKKSEEELKAKQSKADSRKPSNQKELTSSAVHDEKVPEPSSEPGWQFNSNTILPVCKPPHLQSKKPLKRIEIHDIGLNSPTHTCTRSLQDLPGSSTPSTLSVKAQDLPGSSTPSTLSVNIQDLPGSSTPSTLSVKAQDLPGSSTPSTFSVNTQDLPGTSTPSTLSVNPQDLPGYSIPSTSSVLPQSSPGSKPRSILTLNSTTSATQSLPPPPKTSVQFHTSWNGIKSDNNLCYQFLKQIHGNELPNIFKESLESRMFSNIVQILASEFTAAGEEVLPYLQGLSGVRRFSTLALFMSPADKTNLRKLFDYCTHENKGSPDDIGRLRRLYELN